MEQQPVFSWSSYDRMSKLLQSVGYVVVVFGSIAGLIIVAMSDSMMRLAGVLTIAVSILLGLYHVSFSMMMTAMHNMIRKMEGEKIEES